MKILSYGKFKFKNGISFHDVYTNCLRNREMFYKFFFENTYIYIVNIVNFLDGRRKLTDK